jgi:hypothetical protein
MNMNILKIKSIPKNIKFGKLKWLSFTCWKNDLDKTSVFTTLCLNVRFRILNMTFAWWRHLTTRMLPLLPLVSSLVPIVLLFSRGNRHPNEKENSQSILVVVDKWRHPANVLLKLNILIPEISYWMETIPTFIIVWQRCWILLFLLLRL